MLRTLLAVFAVVTVGCSAKPVRSDVASSSLVSSDAVTAKQTKADRKIVKRASLLVEVKELPQAIAKIPGMVEHYGGTVESSREELDGRSHYSLRVPSERLTEALDGLASLGKEKERNVSAEDKTDEFFDLEAKLKNTAAYRDQLRLLLAKAKDVKDVLQIEEQLNRVQSEFDVLEGRMKRLKTDVAMSSVSLSIEKEKILGPLGYIGYGVGWVIMKLFFIQN